MTNGIPETMIFIIDDEYAIRDSLALLIRSRQLSCAVFDSAESFFRELPSYPVLTVGAILLDVRMQGISGIKLFQRLRDLEVIWPVIFLTGHGYIEMAVDAMKSGAFDFIEKPFNNNKLVDVVLEALNECRHRIRRIENGERISACLCALDEGARQNLYHLIENRFHDEAAVLTPGEQDILQQFRVRSLSELYALVDESDFKLDGFKLL